MRNLAICIIFFGLFPLTAFANFDVTCTNDNCWTEGWSIFNQDTRQSSEVQCIGDSCFENGWVERSHGRLVSEVECIESSCWTNGFETYNRDGQWVGAILCLEDPNLGPNCLTAGWKVVNFRNQQVAQIKCVAGDCERFGWDVEFSNGALQIVRCKDESCFTNGWSLRP